MNVTKVYTGGNNYECSVVKRHDGYEIVFPPEVTLVSLFKKDITSVHQALDYLFGAGEWTLK